MNATHCKPVAVIKWPPLVLDPVTYDGSIMKIWKILEDILGVCSEYRSFSTWTEMIGLVRNESAWIGLAPSAYSSDRLKIVDLSEPVFYSDYNILFPRPALESDILGFLKSFSLEAWLALILSFTIFGALSMAILRKSDTFQWIFRQILSQGHYSALYGISPKEWSSSFLMGTWMIACFIVALVYKSNLKALLIIPKIALPFDNIDELVAQQEIGWVFAKNAIVDTIGKGAYESQPDSSLGQLWYKRSLPLPTSPSNVVENFILKKNLAAVLMRYNNEYDVSKAEDCKVISSKGGFYSVPFGFMMKKNSTIQSTVNTVIMRLREFGILKKIMDDEIKKKSDCSLSSYANKERPLQLADFHGTFILWFIEGAWLTVENVPENKFNREWHNSLRIFISSIIFLVEKTMKARKRQ